MVDRMLWLVFIILILWAIAMHFIWKDNTHNPYKVNPNSVALSFDDGPTPPYTSEILSILQQNDVYATFFVLGKNAERYPELVLKAYKEGNAIACHGVNHLDLTTATKEQVESEVLGCKKIIEKIIGKSPICYRPAFNKITPTVQKYIEEQGMVIIKVEIDSTDWKHTDANSIVNTTLSLIAPQSEITMHDGTSESENRSTTVKALPILIQKIKKMGLDVSRICYP
ncbi:polysaccharide deacetylase family protein [Legionella hackeliae]|uniref:Putative Chitin deacetylase n=1 Tax=Legionella hackeliae TaxID=449 RepID=A0A0A8UU45_LEGHA|nr:polysaccharide deacetylase family protein [Legionella hackeliae]KTD12814.1 Peptidoglycan-N-acetylglucosamine deacetylase [Legionella hackeliae]CEK12238.1 putative Chitin deacetylase [Legionella hackeliae]STX49025.1 Bifunctional xylanase/deacetylase precursor [Legionella hackeliae]